MALRNGKQYLEGLRDGREIWLDGKRVEDVTTHPKLRRMAQTQAALYDLQHEPGLKEKMSFTSPSSGEPVSLSYLMPESQDDLMRRKQAFEITANAAHGILGRTPDYINVTVTAMRQMAELYGRKDPRFAENIINYYEYIR